MMETAGSETFFATHSEAFPTQSALETLCRRPRCLVHLAMCNWEGRQNQCLKCFLHHSSNPSDHDTFHMLVDFLKSWRTLQNVEEQKALKEKHGKKNESLWALDLNKGICLKFAIARKCERT